MKISNVVSLCAISIAALAGSASANIVDLTAGNQSGTINGAVYSNNALTPAGSGVIESFVRVSANTNTVQGYNTSARPLSFDENTSPTFTRDLKFGNVPTVLVGGVLYKEFLLDINQTNASPLESLNQVAIFTKATGGATGTNLFGGALGTAVYQMNVGYGGSTGTTITGGGSENRVQLNYSLQSGSGQSDMFLYVPLTNFGAATADTYIYLYSFFGLPSSNNDGYEEWAVRSPGGPVVPLPPAAWAGLAGLGAVGITGFVRRRRMA